MGSRLNLEPGGLPMELERDAWLCLYWVGFLFCFERVLINCGWFSKEPSEKTPLYFTLHGSGGWGGALHPAHAERERSRCRERERGDNCSLLTTLPSRSRPAVVVNGYVTVINWKDVVGTYKYPQEA